MFLGELVCGEVAPNSGDRMAQFLAVVAVPRVSERTEPLVRMGLQDRSASAHHLPALASGVARSTQRAQAALRYRSICCLGQGALACRLTRAVYIEDHPPPALPIPQPAPLSIFLQRACEQIGEKQLTQGFDGLSGQCRQKA